VGKHPNADTLSIGNVYDFPVIVRTGDFVEGQLCVYVPVEAVVPTGPGPFEFLSNGKSPTARIKAKKIRGIFSMGVVVPVPEGLGPVVEGQDVTMDMGIFKYEEPEPIILSGEQSAPPSSARINTSAYGVENIRRCPDAIQPGEDVYVTEKIHGSNARFVYSSEDDKFHVGSHHCWWKEKEGNLWWRAARQYGLEDICRAMPDTTIFGEAFGNQDLKYGLQNGKIDFRVFSIVDKYEPYHFSKVVSTCEAIGLPVVPVLYQGPFDLALVKSLIECPSTFDKNQIMEGAVIRSSKHTLKIHSEKYLLRKNGTEHK